MIIAAIVTAAGAGVRMGNHIPKQYLALNGVPILARTLMVFERHPLIDRIVVTVPPGDEDLCQLEVIEPYRLRKMTEVIAGGVSRQASVYKGLLRLKDSHIISVHDGVRPLIEPSVIKKALQQLNDCDGVVVGVPLKDTVKEVTDGIVRSTPERNSLWAIQTPQVFHFKTLYAAYEKAAADSFYATDDAALVEKYGGKIKVIQGSYTNIKVTTPEDLLVAEVFLKMRRGKS
jgi:2-C-methyl-D-erythritol 4-phosphate cytidylyltransferase